MASPPEDIAVIGLACLFPGAPDVRTFWRNIVGKVDAITDPPPEAWDPSIYFDPAVDDNDRVYCRKGGYLGALAEFDPIEHGIVPRAVEGGEPDQWLALHVAREALRDAGYENLTKYRERSALIVGKGTYANRGTLSMIQHAMLVDYTLDIVKAVQPALSGEELRRVRADLKRRLPRFDSETAPALVPNVTVGRIANRLDIMGPSYTIDAACASSLVAIDIAVKGLRQREYDIALVGGLQVATPQPVLSLFCRLHALSPSERIRPFDKDADGTLLSEGLGMAVLKPRVQAEEDGDRIYALIKGTGVATDGRAVGVLAPRVEGEELALRRAYAQACVAPQSVELIEAHGTGTLVGDAVEIEALRRVFGGRAGRRLCGVGTVKSMIGHTMPAAGMAGFIKAVLALYHRVLPPTINVSEPSPRLGLERTPFYINTEARPWILGPDVRRAGVNSFGFGGINAHTVLEESNPTGSEVSFDVGWDSELCVVAGENRAEVVGALNQLKSALARSPHVPLAELARAQNLRPQPSERAVSIIADTTDDLVRKVDRALTRLGDHACRKIKDPSGIYYFEDPLGEAGKLAFLFPGEGSQYAGMLSDLCRHFPTVRVCFDQINRMFAQHPRGYLLSDVLYPPPQLPGQQTDTGRMLFEMETAVEAVLTANHALHRLLTELGIVPDVLLGHSTGEFSAFRAAGMFLEGDEELVLALNKIYQLAIGADQVPDPVDLIAIGAARDRVQLLCESLGGNATIAMDNCPHQVVVAVRRAVSGLILERCRQQGLLYEVLPFDRPYHTHWFDQFAEGMRDFFTRWIVRPPAIPLYSCTTAGLYPAALDEINHAAVDHWVRPVEFRRTIEKMYADGVRLFVEVGPRGNLTAFIDDVLARQRYAAIPANVLRRSGTTQLHHLLGQLAAHGVRPAFAPLYSRRRLGIVELTDATPSKRKRALGPVKIPTGASEMRLSPEVVALIRRAGGTTAPGRALGASTEAAAAPSRPGEASAQPAATPRAEPAPALVQAVPRNVISSSPPRTGTRTSGVDASATGDVVSAYFGTMAEFLSLEHQFISAVLARRPNQEEPAAWPFLDQILSHRPGESLIGRCTLELDKYPFLRDHTIGRDIAESDPTLTGFPIVPFTALVEMMSEAAVALCPGLVVGASNIRVNRWIAVDEGSIQLEVQADQMDQAAARVRILEVAAPERGPVAEGVVLVAESYPEPPPAEPLALRDAEPFKVPPDRLYETTMFHGPAFRGVRSVDQVSEAGASATVRVLDRSGLFAAGGVRCATDFVLLDQPGQVVGFWAAQRFEQRFFVLPTRLRSLRLFGPSPFVGEQLTCLARVGIHGEHELTSTLDLVRSDGRVWARFEGWDDRRFNLAPRVQQQLLHPQTARLAEPWPHPGRGDDLIARRIGLDAFPPGWLNAHGGLWRRVLGAAVLGRRERELWRSLNVPESRRLEWLLGRIAAKDSVRDYLWRRHGFEIRPADIEILPDANGRPVVGCRWSGRAGPPHVSISHIDGVAIAIAGDREAFSGIGVDLERRGRLRTNMETVAFSDGERGILGEFAGIEREMWSTRFWCAKEAFSKSTGGSVSPLSRLISVERVDREHGTVMLRYDAIGLSGVTFPVPTSQDGDWIVATCLAVPNAIQTGVHR